MHMADNYYDRSVRDDADYFIKAAKAAKKVRKSLQKRADAYLEGTYDPKKEIKKHTVRGVTTALVMLSLLTGIAFSSPADIADEQAASAIRPTPVVMDVDDFVNAPVEDDDDDADEQKGSRLSFVARFRQAVLSLPQAVRILIITPLWVIGTGLMTGITFLWNVIFASPLGAFIASFALGFAILLGLLAATSKILFPDVPLRKVFCKRNLLILGAAALLLTGFDAAAPLYWRQYPLAAWLLKLVFGGTVVAVLAKRTKALLARI